MSTERDELAAIIKHEYVRAIDRKRPQDCWNAPADAILSIGYRKPRIVRTLEELDALPTGSMIRDNTGEFFERGMDTWYASGATGAYKAFPSWIPATVLYEPTA